MDYTFSGFTANMPTPTSYMHDIFDLIPNTIDRLYRRLNEPIVLVMIGIVLVVGFLFALLDN